VRGVFPGAGAGTAWYDWYNLSAVAVASGAQNVTLDAPLGHLPLFVRGGHVVPLQEPAMTTAESRRSPWGLLVALDAGGAASGSLYLDDGESLRPEAVTWVELTGSTSSVVARPRGNYTDGNPLANATVMGLQDGPKTVLFNERALGSDCWSYDPEAKVLRVTKLNPLTPRGAWAASWALEWS